MFKVGDIVKIIGNRKANWISDRAEIIGKSEYKVDCFVVKDLTGVYTLNNYVHKDDMELINNFNNMSLTEKLLSSLKKEPEKSFRNAGITNGDDIPTDEGVKLICTVILQKNEEVRKAITEIAKDILKEEEKK